MDSVGVNEIDTLAGNQALPVLPILVTLEPVHVRSLMIAALLACTDQLAPLNLFGASFLEPLIQYDSIGFLLSQSGTCLVFRSISAIVDEQCLLRVHASIRKRTFDHNYLERVILGVKFRNI